MKDEELDRLFREQIKDIPGTPAGTNFRKEMAWERIGNQLAEKPAGGTGRRFVWMAAAAVILLAVVSFLLLRGPATINNANLAGTEKDSVESNMHEPVDQKNPLALDHSQEDSGAIMPIEVSPDPEPQMAVQKPLKKVQPKAKPGLEMNTEPLMNAELGMNSLTSLDTAMDTKKSLVKVRVILAENKPDKEAVLHAEWEKQNRLRIQIHDQFSDRIRAGNREDDIFPLFNSPSPFRTNIDLDILQKEDPKR